MIIKAAKRKVFFFTIARMTESLYYSLGDTDIPKAKSCKYLGIILRRCLSWDDQENYIAKKAWNTFHFTMRILKGGNRNSKT
jgi:hypothetical protein